MTKLKLALALLLVAGISGLAVFAYMSISLVKQVVESRNTQIQTLESQINDLKGLTIPLTK